MVDSLPPRLFVISYSREKKKKSPPYIAYQRDNEFTIKMRRLFNNYKVTSNLNVHYYYFFFLPMYIQFNCYQRVVNIVALKIFIEGCCHDMFSECRFEIQMSSNNYSMQRNFFHVFDDIKYKLHYSNIQMSSMYLINSYNEGFNIDIIYKFTENI